MLVVIDTPLAPLTGVVPLTRGGVVSGGGGPACVVNDHTPDWFNGTPSMSVIEVPTRTKYVPDTFTIPEYGTRYAVVGSSVSTKVTPDRLTVDTAPLLTVNAEVVIVPDATGCENVAAIVDSGETPDVPLVGCT